YCKYALLELSVKDLPADQRIDRLWHLATDGNGVAPVVAATELIRGGHRVHLDAVIRSLSKNEDYRSGIAIPIRYALEHPNRPPVYSGPHELQIVQQVIAGEYSALNCAELPVGSDLETQVGVHGSTTE